MKKMFSLVVVIVLFVSLMSGCTTGNKPYSNYTEICDTESYDLRKFSLSTEFFNFSLGKYFNIYTSHNGYVCKFYDTGELRTTYENTYGFSAPYYFDEYIYAMSTDGCLYKIQNNSGEMSVVSEKMSGYAANCIVVNSDFALLTMHTTNDSEKFSLKLMRVDLASGEATELDLGSDQRIYCSAGGVMYVYAKEVIDREEVYSLYEIPAEGKPIFICDMTDIGETSRFILENGVFYYANQMGDLCAKSLINGEGSICVPGAGIYGMGEYAENGMVFLDGNIFYYNANTASIESAFILNFGIGDKSLVKICAPDKESVSHIDIESLNRYTDANLSYTYLSEDEIALKILAGDDDADIYFISASLAGKLLDKNIYTPIESDIVKNFNESCFDYINDACFAENGDIALMPISNYVYGIVYPTASFKEAGIAREDLLYYKGFMDCVRNKSTEKHAFQFGNVIYNSLLMQYAEYYCNFENGEFDFTSDAFKEFFTDLCTYYPDYDSWEPYGFTHPRTYDPEVNPELIGKEELAHYSTDLTFMSISFYNYYYHAIYCPTFFEEWRAIPMPRLSEDVTANYVELEFAVINPYSKNKEAATKLLEDIATNYMSVRGGQAAYSFLLEDKSAYSSDYHPESQVFNDFYNIAKDGFIFTYEIGSAVICDNYSRGLISAEEALEELQRQVNISLNE